MRFHTQPKYTFLILISIITLAFSGCIQNSGIHLSENEKQWLEANKTEIKVLWGYDSPPDAFHNEEGEYVGVLIDFQEVIEDILGIKFQSVYLKDWEELMKYTKTNRNYIVYGAAVTPSRLEYMNFTNSLINEPYTILTRKNSEINDAKDLDEKLVFVGKDYAAEEYLKIYHPDVNLYGVKNEVEGIKLLSSGKGDALVISQFYATYLIHNQTISNLDIKENIGYLNKLAIAVSKDDVYLHQILEKAVNEIDPKTRKSIYNKWMFDTGKSFSNSTIFTYLFITSFSIFGLFVLFVIIRSLRKTLSRKKFELKESEAKFRSISENSNDAIILIQNDQVSYINKKFFDIFGYKYEDVFSRDFLFEKLVVQPEKLKEKLMSIKSNGINSDNSFVSFEGLNKSNEKLCLEASISIAPYQTQEALLLIIRDISTKVKTEKELILAKEKAEENDRLKSAFLANISHEIRTPMNGIMGFTQLLGDDFYSADEKKSYIRIIEKSGQRMLNTLNDIINISKIESGQVNVHYQKIELIDLINYHYQFFKPECKAKGLNLIFFEQEEKEETIIYSDHEKLSAIITNLIKNAIKYTENGFVEIKCEISENQFIFSVTDSGIGIPKEKLTHIFDRFIQVENPQKTNKDGIGLGLAIVKAYVETLQGNIIVESTVNKGSSFKVILPLNLKHN